MTKILKILLNNFYGLNKVNTEKLIMHFEFKKSENQTKPRVKESSASPDTLNIMSK